MTDIDLGCAPADELPLLTKAEVDALVRRILTSVPEKQRRRLWHSILSCQEKVGVKGLGEQGIAELMLRIGLLNAIIRKRKETENGKI